MGSRSPDTPEPPRPRGKKAPVYSARCKARLRGGQLRRGTAVLGPGELRFHTGRTGREGEDFVLHLRFDDITALEVDGPAGILKVTTGEEGEVVFHLARLAVPWKERIEARPDLRRDLGLGARARIAWVGIDDDVMLAALGPGSTSDPGDGLDAIFAGVEHRADLARLATLAQRVRSGGLIWAVYPPESRSIAEADIFAAARAAGLVDGRAVELAPERLALRLTRR